MNQKQPDEVLSEVVARVVHLGDSEIFGELGRKLVFDAGPGGTEPEKRGREWFASIADFIRARVCGNTLLRGKTAEDTQELACAIAAALAGAEYPPVAWALVGVLVARIGLDKWCPDRTDPNNQGVC